MSGVAEAIREKLEAEGFEKDKKVENGHASAGAAWDAAGGKKAGEAEPLQRKPRGVKSKVRYEEEMSSRSERQNGDKLVFT